MLRATLKSLLSRKLRLTLSALAVVLGVMFVAGALIMTGSLSASYQAMFASVTKSIDVQVTAKPKLNAGQSDAAPAPIPASVADQVKAAPGVKKSTPSVFAEGARVIGKDGKVTASFAPRFGSSWTGENDLVQLRSGRGPRAPDEVVLDVATAKSAGYKIGDRLGILTLQPKQEFTLVGIFGYSGGRDTLGGSQVVAFTLPVAQQLMLGEKNVYNQIDLVAQDGVSQTQLKKTIQDTLGSSYQVRTRDEVNKASSDDINQGLSFFNYILLGFAGVALFVGIFLILNTFSMLVAQRTRELALFRAMGANRRQVIGSVLLEALLIGLLASTIGLIAGIGIGYGLGSLFAHLGTSDLDLVLTVPASAVIASFAVGVGVTLIAALFPALRASRIPPIAAMRDAATPDKPLTRITIGGGVVFALGAGAMCLSLFGSLDGSASLWLLLGGVLVTFIGVALLTPIISRPVVAVLGRVFAWSVPGQLGRRNSARNPRRTAITAAALMVSIALVTGVSTILSSVTKSIDTAVGEQLNAQLIIYGQQTGPVAPTFSESALTAMKHLDGVDTVAAAYIGPARINGKTNGVAALDDPAAVQRVLGLKPKTGRIDEISANQLIVDEDTAKNAHLAVGDPVKVQLVKGDLTTYTVTGIYEKSNTVSGYMLPKAAVQNFQVAQPSQAFVKVKDGVSVDKVERQVKDLLADSPEVTVQNQSDYIHQISSIFNTILVAVQVLLGLALLIAILGIINTLALSVIERTRELGLLRAIGLRRSQTTRMITVESIVISVFGALLGIVVGVGFGAVVVQALKSQGLGQFALPWFWIVIYLIGSVFVGVIAALLPALRAARLNVLAAISYE